MLIGIKRQRSDAEEINRGSVHEFWENGDATRVFTKAEGYPRAFRVDVSGTLVVKDWQDPDGTRPAVQETYNVLQGEILTFSFSEIDDTSTASVHIWW